MTNRTLGILLAPLLSAALGAGGDDLPSTGPAQGKFRIVVPELASEVGSVRMYVHERTTFSSDNLKKLERGTCLAASVVEIENGEAVWTTDPLPYGEYAIIVHHDLNNDGIVNFGKLLPSEAIGYSNYDHAIAAYPDFDRARIVLDQPLFEVRVDAFMQGRIFRKRLRA